ncbi:sodium/glutamate symporter [Clostridium botulinum]|uniref:Sodium/glutamate symporter n=3 Tax=Clostridium botulinum TaxID=1491 RepID=A0A9Q1UYR4_CLOBO|nr:sodium/glutamate symporter [Clostridium botulinum]AEB76045.1 sodium/glutamate symporter [Clostridium botulinum BKT015925]KEI02429.1 sodium:glutamate symporter [Clostridium botulinum D str. 16868]KEI04101.1 sodium:glutamate symporter [Clostridium botulinum C/D str. Sp77]KLU75738.1 sodium:glutamate symporter [Clostridium botulinum V891]KOA74811.1 sodium:glutamate symporter [Clostridium botulinum]
MNIKLDIFSTMALATFVFYVGIYCKNKINVFSKYCIPAPVIGGLLFAILVLVLKINNIATITLDTTLQNIFMTAFFTSIGFTASIKILKKGGITVIIFLILSILLVISQNILGVSLAKLFKLNPLLGLCTGSVSMVGGHGTSGSFGPLLEGLNVKGATTVAFASATFGLVMGSLIGGFVAKNLIERYKLNTPKISEDASIPLSDFHEDDTAILCHTRLMHAVSWIFMAMGIGTLISKFIQNLGLTFPSYIGAMMAAAIIRNICDFKKVELENKEIETIGGISLAFFLSMALMGLKLWELFDLALPMFVMLIGQALLMIVFSYFVVFKVLGKNYDAAVFASANCGFGMGATPNAVANMDALTTKFGFAPTPYLVVPIVGCLFIDFVNSAVITIFINFIH